MLTCQKIAPSQAKLPPVEPLVPNYPFEHICIDYMSLNGHEFGVLVDRYKGGPGMTILEHHVSFSPTGTLSSTPFFTSASSPALTSSLK